MRMVYHSGMMDLGRMQGDLGLDAVHLLAQCCLASFEARESLTAKVHSHAPMKNGCSLVRTWAQSIEVLPMNKSRVWKLKLLGVAVRLVGQAQPFLGEKLPPHLQDHKAVLMSPVRNVQFALVSTKKELLLRDCRAAMYSATNV